MGPKDALTCDKHRWSFRLEQNWTTDLESQRSRLLGLFDYTGESYKYFSLKNHATFSKLLTHLSLQLRSLFFEYQGISIWMDSNALEPHLFCLSTFMLNCLNCPFMDICTINHTWRSKIMPYLMVISLEKKKLMFCIMIFWRMFD